MKVLLSIMIMMITVMMYFMNNPLSMGLLILIQTMLICLITGMLINTYWFSYILFLTFLGGLLVMFIYVSSVASNEMFKISVMFYLKFMMFMMMMLIMFILYFNNLKFLNLLSNEEMMNLFNNYLNFNNENKMNLTKMYNNQTYLLMMLMIIYLFITLLAVVKISNIFYGPIRSMIN